MRYLSALLALLLTTTLIQASTHNEVQERIDADIADGKPILVHVVVALCDNANQQIWPVPKALGNGQDPKGNLYWGAMYGVKTYMTQTAGWQPIKAKSLHKHILERLVLHIDIKRNNKSVPVYIVADAWDGAYIKQALKAYLQMTAGHSTEKITVAQGDNSSELTAGGASHLLVYIGHNGLMDFSLPDVASTEQATLSKSAMVLACQSKPYFLKRLKAFGVHPLVLTTGNMAPEAYTLDSVIRAWVSNSNNSTAEEAAAKAYHRYQKCGLKAANRLFWGEQ